MTVDWRERIGWLWRMALVQAVTIILLILGTLSFAIPYLSEIRPYFVMMAIFYWSIYRPSVVSPILVFMLGLALDILTQAPIGLNALIFVVLQWVVSHQRVFLMGQPYVMIWIGFGFTAALCASIQFLVYLILSGGAPLPTDTLVASTVLTFVLFPPVSLIFIFLHRLLPQTA
jgi:rod shape-determining protein MreD